MGGCFSVTMSSFVPALRRDGLSRMNFSETQRASESKKRTAERKYPLGCGARNVYRACLSVSILAYPAGTSKRVASIGAEPKLVISTVVSIITLAAD